MKKILIYLLLLIGFGLGVFVFVSFVKKISTSPNVGNVPKAVMKASDAEQAIFKAQQIFAELKSEGTDFSTGPCIAEDLMPDWVADVAHDPRQPVDDLPENQCQSFRNGQAHHFVELNTEGAFIRAY